MTISTEHPHSLSTYARQQWLLQGCTHSDPLIMIDLNYAEDKQLLFVKIYSYTFDVQASDHRGIVIEMHMSLSVDLISQLSTGSCVGWLDCIKRITSTTPGWYRRPTQSSGSEIMLWQSSENTELFVPLALCHLSVIPKVDSIFTTWHTITKTFLPKSELASLCFLLWWFTNSCFTCQRGTHLSVLKR